MDESSPSLKWSAQDQINSKQVPHGGVSLIFCYPLTPSLERTLAQPHSLSESFRVTYAQMEKDDLGTKLTSDGGIVVLSVYSDSSRTQVKEILATLSEKYNGSDLRLIVVVESAQSIQGVMERYVRLGAHEVVIGPVVIKQLEAAFERQRQRWLKRVDDKTELVEEQAPSAESKSVAGVGGVFRCHAEQVGQNTWVFRSEENREGVAPDQVRILCALESLDANQGKWESADDGASWDWVVTLSVGQNSVRKLIYKFVGNEPVLDSTKGWTFSGPKPQLRDMEGGGQPIFTTNEKGDTMFYKRPGAPQVVEAEVQISSASSEAVGDVDASLLAALRKATKGRFQLD